MDCNIFAGTSIFGTSIPSNSNTSTYTLPIATKNTLGGVKIGESINISSDGIIDVSLSSISESEIDDIIGECFGNGDMPPISDVGITYEDIDKIFEELF